MYDAYGDLVSAMAAGQPTCVTAVAANPPLLYLHSMPCARLRRVYMKGGRPMADLVGMLDHVSYRPGSAPSAEAGIRETLNAVNSQVTSMQLKLTGVAARGGRPQCLYRIASVRYNPGEGPEMEVDFEVSTADGPVTVTCSLEDSHDMDDLGARLLTMRRRLKNEADPASEFSDVVGHALRTYYYDSDNEVRSLRREFCSPSGIVELPGSDFLGDALRPERLRGLPDSELLRRLGRGRCTLSEMEPVLGTVNVGWTVKGLRRFTSREDAVGAMDTAEDDFLAGGVGGEYVIADVELSYTLLDRGRLKRRLRNRFKIKE